MRRFTALSLRCRHQQEQQGKPVSSHGGSATFGRSVCCPFGHRLDGTFQLPRVVLRPMFGLQEVSVVSSTQWPLCLPHRPRLRPANATKLFRAPRYARRVDSRTWISASSDWRDHSIVAAISVPGVFFLGLMECEFFSYARLTCGFVLVSLSCPLHSWRSRCTVVIVVFFSI